VNPAVEIIRPRDRAAWLAARSTDVTASQVGALFGEHEYLSAYELWALKSGRLARSVEETPAMQRGRLLEPVAVQMLRERFPGWKIRHNAAENIYFRDPLWRLGATPDVIAERPLDGTRRRELGVVQIKSVEASTFRRKWLDAAGEVEAPLWIALQATLEAHLVGASWAAVAPLVVGHGLDMPLVEIPLIPGVVDAMRERAAAFWAMVLEGREPTPDFERDGPVIEAVYAGDPEAEVDLSTNNRIRPLMHARTQALASRAAAEREVDQIDAELKAALGDASVGHIGNGQRITWLTQKRDGYFVSPKAFRVLKVPALKE
jgi:hypothetical protein